MSWPVIKVWLELFNNGLLLLATSRHTHTHRHFDGTFHVAFTVCFVMMFVFYFVVQILGKYIYHHKTVRLTKFFFSLVGTLLRLDIHIGILAFWHIISLLFFYHHPKYGGWSWKKGLKYLWKNWMNALFCCYIYIH